MCASSLPEPFSAAFLIAMRAGKARCASPARAVVLFRTGRPCSSFARMFSLNLCMRQHQAVSLISRVSRFRNPRSIPSLWQAVRRKLHSRLRCAPRRHVPRLPMRGIPATVLSRSGRVRYRLVRNAGQLGDFRGIGLCGLTHGSGRNHHESPSPHSNELSVGYHSLAGLSPVSGRTR